MEHFYIVKYFMDGQEESLDVVTKLGILTQEEARKRVEAAVKPYGKTYNGEIKIIKMESADVIDTDPQTSASE